jgi:hypothetical protein
MKMAAVDRMLLLAAAILAAYQVSVGIEGFSALPIIAYTIAFGVLLVAVLLLFILGFEALDSPAVVIVSTVIPLSLSLGLAWQHLVPYRSAYLAFCLVGFMGIVFTRAFPMPGRISTLTLAVIHGIAGLTIFLLPIWVSIRGTTQPLFSLIGIGGALIGMGGLLLSFLKAGRPILSRETILRIFPALLLAMTALFVAGFRFG